MAGELKVGDWVNCPVCGGKAQVVWVSKDGGAAAVKCPSHHRHMVPPRSTKKGVKKRGMVFLVAIPEK